MFRASTLTRRLRCYEVNKARQGQRPRWTFYVMDQSSERELKPHVLVILDSS